MWLDRTSLSHLKRLGTTPFLVYTRHDPAHGRHLTKSERMPNLSVSTNYFNMLHNNYECYYVFLSDGNSLWVICSLKKEEILEIRAPAVSTPYSEPVVSYFNVITSSLDNVSAVLTLERTGDH